MDLPYEIIVIILQNVPQEYLLGLRKVSKLFREAVKVASYRNPIYIRDNINCVEAFSFLNLYFYSLSALRTSSSFYKGPIEPGMSRNLSYMNMRKFVYKDKKYSIDETLATTLDFGTCAELRRIGLGASVVEVILPPSPIQLRLSKKESTIPKLRGNISQLKDIHVYDSKLSIEEISHFLDEFPKLESVDVRRIFIDERIYRRFNLAKLNIFKCKISTVDVSGLHLLKELSIKGGKKTTLIGLESCISLERLKLDNVLISSLTLDLPKLEHISILNSLLEKIYVKSHLNKFGLFVESSILTSCVVIGNGDSYITLRAPKLEHLELPTSTRSLSISSTKLRYLDYFDNLISIYISKGSFETIKIPKTLTCLYINNSKIKTLITEDISKITHLRLNNVNIENFITSKNQDLGMFKDLVTAKEDYDEKNDSWMIIKPLSE